MAKIWKEPLDTSHHLDHFHYGGARARKPLPLGLGFSYFVEVAGFTFEFPSVAAVAKCLAFFEMRIHPSSRREVFEPEKGEWQSWDERLPVHIRKRSKRDRVTKALRKAIIVFKNE